jgi:hypothetical protein
VAYVVAVNAPLEHALDRVDAEHHPIECHEPSCLIFGTEAKHPFGLIVGFHLVPSSP